MSLAPHGVAVARSCESQATAGRAERHTQGYWPRPPSTRWRPASRLTRVAKRDSRSPRRLIPLGWKRCEVAALRGPFEIQKRQLNAAPCFLALSSHGRGSFDCVGTAIVVRFPDDRQLAVYLFSRPKFGAAVPHLNRTRA